jgi:hypothetical protein
MDRNYRTDRIARFCCKYGSDRKHGSSWCNWNNRTNRSTEYLYWTYRRNWKHRNDRTSR